MEDSHFPTSEQAFHHNGSSEWATLFLINLDANITSLALNYTSSYSILVADTSEERCEVIAGKFTMLQILTVNSGSPAFSQPNDPEVMWPLRVLCAFLRTGTTSLKLLHTLHLGAGIDELRAAAPELPLSQAAALPALLSFTYNVLPDNSERNPSASVMQRAGEEAARQLQQLPLQELWVLGTELDCDGVVAPPGTFAPAARVLVTQLHDLSKVTNLLLSRLHLRLPDVAALKQMKQLCSICLLNVTYDDAAQATILQSLASLPRLPALFLAGVDKERCDVPEALAQARSPRPL